MGLELFRYMLWPCTSIWRPCTNVDRGISDVFSSPSSASSLATLLFCDELPLANRLKLPHNELLIQMKRYSQWGARLFFSATVAFSVPSIYKDGGLLRLKPFWKGLVLTVAAVVGKLVVGLYAGPPLTLSGFLKLGWAMNGRCDFVFRPQ